MGVKRAVDSDGDASMERHGKTADERAPGVPAFLGAFAPWRENESKDGGSRQGAEAPRGRLTEADAARWGREVGVRRAVDSDADASTVRQGKTADE